ncbi:cytosine permease [uncultured Fusobacterium sp.]|jgi:cytosine permease|uniref:cytosine permease n=1 Tax=Fusobacterium sp. HC1336 TaxID=3171169 RepID=UPI0025E73744|nr:cytosine permease [uncultured Fusobacterium sp.]
MKELNVEKEMLEDSEYSLSKVPNDKKTQGIWAAMVVLVGFTFFTPSMTAGGNLGIGLNFREFFIAVIMGNAFLGVYCGVLAYIGQKTGLTLDLLGRHSFGNIGSYLSSALISFTQIGWFGVGVAMFAIPVSKLIGVPVWILIVITGIIMTVTAYRGIKALAVLGSIAVPLIAILGVYSVNWGIEKMGGFFEIFSENPANPLTLSSGIAIVVGSFVSGGTATPNFTRFAKDSKTAVVATVVAFFVGNSIMMIFGAVGGAVTGVPDIFDILILQGLAIPAAITLGLNIWTTNNNALYTAGLGVSNITKINMKPMVLVGGGIGTITAVWLYYNFVGFLNLLSGMIPPVGAVIILHYINHRSEYETTENIPDFNMSGILAVLGGALIGIFLPFGIKPINSLVSAAIIFIILDKIIGGKK